ncbi:MAG: ATP-binding protein [Candidatus Falkowbacteria bacterium]
MEKSGFRVRIKDLDNLYRDFLSNRVVDNYLLGSLFLGTGPLGAISVNSTKVKGNFSVCFTLEANYTDEDGLQFERLKIPIKFLNKSKDFAFEVVASDASKVAVMDESGMEEYFIKISDDDLLIGFGYDETPRKQIVSQENFQKVLESLGALVKVITIGLYQSYNLRVPKKTLLLSAETDVRIETEDDAVKSDKTKKVDSALPKLVIKPSLIMQTKPVLTFDAIGGQAEAKNELMCIAESLKYQDKYQEWGTRPPKGILLHGPSGTGKTILAGALANAIDANFYSINLKEIFSMWYGESVQNTQRVFDEARADIEYTKKPGLIFFDEIDALVGDRDGSHEETGRVIQVILTNLDGLVPCTGLTVIAATNRLNAIDNAFKRPNRMDKLIKVDLPSAIDRQEIFLIHMDKSEKIASRLLFDRTTFNWPLVTEQSDLMSGAEIAEMVRRVLEEKARQEIATSVKPELATCSDILRHIAKYERRTKTKSIGFAANSR